MALRLLRQTSLLLLAAGTCGCTPQLLAPGIYIEQAGAGAILLEGSTLTIKDNSSFAYERWSDDLSSGRYGAGTYQLRGRRLWLRFSESPPIAAQAQATLLVPRPDSLIVTFKVLSPTPGVQANLAPVPGAVVTGRAADGSVLLAVASDEAGQARLALARAAGPVWLQAEHVGLVTWRQACPLASTDYRVSLPPAQGTPYEAGKVKEFRVRRLTARHLVLSQGGRKSSLVRQAGAQ